MFFHRDVLENYWIGLEKDNPRPNDKTGWGWVDGTPYDLSTHQWGHAGGAMKEQPSGHSGEQCVLHRGEQQWLDEQCNKKHRYICKKGELSIGAK